MKRTLAILIALMLLFGSVNLCGAETAAFAGGSGTAEDPYLISTPAQLDQIRNAPAACYRLINDIVFTAEDFAEGGIFYNGGICWTPIPSFTGALDGNGYAIKNLTVRNNSTTERFYAGLFRSNSGTIHDLGMENNDFYAWTTYEQAFIPVCAGGIAGYNSGTITRCYHTGSIEFVAMLRYSQAGGIVGLNAGIVTDCYNTGTVEAYQNWDSSHAAGGGIAGRNEGRILRCYNNGSVTAGGRCPTSNGFAGGIAGTNSGGTIQDCYNIGSVYGFSTGKTYGNAGGITACHFTGSVSSCYNTGTVTCSDWLGAIIGQNNAGSDLSTCYYLDTMNAGSGLYDDAAHRCSMQQLQKAETFAGFDFEGTWIIAPAFGYRLPQLVSLLHTYAPDDLSGDGILDTGDIVRLLQDFLSGEADLSGYDFTDDGQFTIADVIFLLRQTAK
ncbi:MAG: hypothetical protein IJ043_03495 [Clostridia bacterium]|nr:hypothetical protein [Clostridia bacterium]